MLRYDDIFLEAVAEVVSVVPREAVILKFGLCCCKALATLASTIFLVLDIQSLFVDSVVIIRAITISGSCVIAAAS